MHESVEPLHVSVMPAEVLATLDPQPGQVVVDCTVGAGGHTRLLAERVAPGGTVIGIDQDPTMLSLARTRLGDAPVRLVHASFDDLYEVLQTLQIGPVDGVLADLGFSS